MPSTQSVGQLQPAWHIHCRSYSPELFFPSINYFSCIPNCKDQQPGTPRAAGSGWLCEQPAMMLRGKYRGPLPSDGSQKPSFPSHTVNLGQYSQFLLCTPTKQEFLWISKWNLTPTNLSRLSRVSCSFRAPKSMHCAPRGIWLQVLCIAQMSFLNEDPKKKKEFRRI